MHAFGVIHGFQKNGYKTFIYSGFFKKNDFPQGEFTPHCFLNFQLSQYFWRIKFWSLFLFRFNSSFYNKIIIRYSISSFFFFVLLAITKKKDIITIELNSLFSDWIKNKLLKKIIFICEKLVLSKFQNVICVSSIHSNYFKNGTFIPNGSFRINFKHKEYFNSKNPNIKIFGTLHDYYDYTCFKNLNELLIANIVKSIQIFGGGDMLTELSKRFPSFVFHGQYKHYELSNLISIQDDILFVPPKKEFDMSFTGGLSTRLFEFIGSGAITLVPEYENTPYDNNSVFFYDYNDLLTIKPSVKKIISLSGKLSYLTLQNQSDFKSRYSWESRVLDMINT